MTSCIAYGCTNRRNPSMPKLTFHRFPSDRHSRLLWMKAVRRANWEPSSVSTLCSEHFEEECFDRSSHLRTRLKENAVPTKFRWNSLPRKNRKRELLLAARSTTQDSDKASMSATTYTPLIISVGSTVNKSEGLCTTASKKPITLYEEDNSQLDAKYSITGPVNYVPPSQHLHNLSNDSDVIECTNLNNATEIEDSEESNCSQDGDMQAEDSKVINCSDEVDTQTEDILLPVQPVIVTVIPGIQVPDHNAQISETNFSPKSLNHVYSDDTPETTLNKHVSESNASTSSSDFSQIIIPKSMSCFSGEESGFEIDTYDSSSLQIDSNSDDDSNNKVNTLVVNTQQISDNLESHTVTSSKPFSLALLPMVNKVIESVQSERSINDSAPSSLYDPDSQCLDVSKWQRYLAECRKNLQDKIEIPPRPRDKHFYKRKFEAEQRRQEEYHDKIAKLKIGVKEQKSKIQKLKKEVRLLTFVDYECNLNYLMESLEKDVKNTSRKLVNIQKEFCDIII